MGNATPETSGKKEATTEETLWAINDDGKVDAAPDSRRCSLLTRGSGQRTPERRDYRVESRLIAAVGERRTANGASRERE